MPSNTRQRDATVQFVNGDFALVPRTEYERLLRTAREAAEDAADLKTARNAKRALAEGREVRVPVEFAKRIAGGENAVRVVREWRGMGQGALAEAANISQSYLSDIERDARKGTAALTKRLAAALQVPTDLLIDD